MTATHSKTQYLKIALAVSLILIILWALLGAGTSLAWFNDESEEVKNVFHMAEFELDVSYLDDNGKYVTLEGATDLFDENALYEPGYVKTVFLKVENKGDVPFNFKTAVTVTDYALGTNVFGKTFALSDKLEFGLSFSEDEDKLKQELQKREVARATATTPLGNYSTNKAFLDEKSTVYMAITVVMPEEVGNDANYRGKDIPTVHLGITVEASQTDIP